MKKLLILFALLCVAIQVMAADVSVSMASSSAQRFLASHSGKNAFNAAVPTIKWVHQEINSSRANQAVYYVVNTDRGFVVVAGDDRAQEILAYGDGSLKDMSSLPENMKFWLDTYKQQMEYLQAHPGLEVEKPSLKGNRTESIEPMLVAKWDQGYPYYNQCPMDGDRRGLTGCATTSLAQVFYKWQYPTQPTPEVPGYTTRTRHFDLQPLPSITFDWANMLPVYNYSANDAQRNAVAWLMRYIGQAEQMDYTNEGSEAWEDDILRACHLFGYVDARVEYKAKLNFDTNGENMLINDADWSVMLQDELAAGRPVVYCAYDYSSWSGWSGHAFNVDGYTPASNTYHVNWGWSGDGNGDFALNAFSSSGYTFNIEQQMVIGIQPPAQGPSIKANPSKLTIAGLVDQSVTSTFTVKGKALTSAITMTLNDGNGCFTMDASSVSVDEQEAGKVITVAYAPKAVGTHTATITLSSPGAEDEDVELPHTSMVSPGLAVKYSQR